VSRHAAPFLVLIAGCATSAGHGPAPAPGLVRHFELEGEVRAADTLAPVPGASIEVEGARDVGGALASDATGRFALALAVAEAAPPTSAGWAARALSTLTGGEVDRPDRPTPPAVVRVRATAGPLCSEPRRVDLPGDGRPIVLFLGPCGEVR
jgi:hypothetical protein